MTNVVAQTTGWGAVGCSDRVDTIIMREVFSCRTSEWLQAVWSAMNVQGLQRIPVIDEDGKPIGILSWRDTLQSLLGEVEDEEALLRDYVMNVGC